MIIPYYSNNFTTFYKGDCRTILQSLPDNSIDCCITSPPYFGLRDYGINNQIGNEQTAEKYIEQLVIVFREVRRVIKNNGTLWLNLGDSYRNKNLIGIPWRVAFALQADGWYLRQDIIWSKPNPMPESVTDRCTKAHEYIFLLSKNGTYYFDNIAIMEPAKNPEDDLMRINAQTWNNKSAPDQMRQGLRPRGRTGKNAFRGQGHFRKSETGAANRKDRDMKNVGANSKMRNRRSVWTVATKPYKDAHFATFPIELIKPCILAGCPENGIVLDPFIGSGTTAMAADQLKRQSIGIDLNVAYLELAKKRISNNQIKLIA